MGTKTCPTYAYSKWSSFQRKLEGAGDIGPSSPSQSEFKVLLRPIKVGLGPSLRWGDDMDDVEVRNFVVPAKAGTQSFVF